jgi:hypothetical protein
MKEAVVVKGGWGVSPGVIAVLPGEAGRVKRRVGQGLAGARVVALDAAGRVWHWVTGRGRVGSGEQRSSLYRLIGVEDQVSWELAPVAHFQREPSSG